MLNLTKADYWAIAALLIIYTVIFFIGRLTAPQNMTISHCPDSVVFMSDGKGMEIVCAPLELLQTTIKK